jgi:ferric-dicitrate binding protein FerR (iron transport regulator)
MRREDAMTTGIEKRAERLATWKRDLQAQDEAWKRACETLARLGRVSVLVPDEFLKQLEALAATCAEESTSPTRGAVRA